MKRAVFVFVFISVFVSLYSGIVKNYTALSDWEKCTLKNADISYDEGTVRILRIYDDEFESTQLSPRWVIAGHEWGAGDPFWSSGNGRLTICAKDTSIWWGSNYKAPVIYQQIENTNFSIETKIVGLDIEPATGIYREVFLFIFGKSPTDDVIKMGAAVDWRANVNMRTKSHKFVERNLTKLPIFIKMEKINEKVSGYYKYEEEDAWTEIYTVDKIEGEIWKNIKAGIYYTANDNTCGSVEYFRYYGQKTFTSAEVTSDPIYLGGTPAGDGTISWQQDTGLYGSVKVRTRTSDDSVSWSDWSGWYDDNFGSVITSPKKMYVQFHAVLETTDTNESPVLYGVTIDYPQIEKDKELITDFKVYPTISTGSVNAVFKINDFIKEIRAEIKESSGKTVREIDVPDTPGTHQTEINTSMLANGVYFLKIRAYTPDGVKTLQVKKFVVKK